MSHEIHTLVKQYFQLVELPQLSIPPNDVLIQPAVQEALYERMFDESLTPLPPPTYRARVLKLLLSRIEEAITDPEEDEILDALMETWGNLLTMPKPSALDQAQQLSLIKYTAPISTSPIPSPSSRNSSSSTDTSLERTVITSESRGLILAGGTTGNRTWEAALHLGTYLALFATASEMGAGGGGGGGTDEFSLRGKRVIELGAGTGFLSLFCAKYLGARVLATDREPFLIDNMRNCVGINRVSGSESDIPMYPGIWDWGTELQVDDVSGREVFLEDGKVGFDVALGADLIYDADIIPLLVSTVRDLFENYSVKEFIISATKRNEKTFQTFLEACEASSFIVEALPFQSPCLEEQTGFFHSTSIPIHTYRILPSV